MCMYNTCVCIDSHRLEEKELMDMDTSVVVIGEREVEVEEGGYRMDKW